MRAVYCLIRFHKAISNNRCICVPSHSVTLQAAFHSFHLPRGSETNNVCLCLPHLQASTVVQFYLHDTVDMALDSILFIAKRYGFDCAGFQPRYGQEIFSSPHQSRTALRPTKPPAKWVLRSFPGGTAAGLWFWYPPTSGVEVKNKWR